MRRFVVASLLSLGIGAAQSAGAYIADVDFEYMVQQRGNAVFWNFETTLLVRNERSFFLDLWHVH